MRLFPFLRRRQSILRTMRQEWDERARQNARYHIATDDWQTEEEFDQSGEASVADVLSDIGPFLSSDATALEIGCGIGRILRPLAKRFRTVYGVDISPEMIRRAKKRLSDLRNVRLWVNNGEDLRPLGAGQVDLAISYIVFQHIPDPAVIQKYIEDACRVLKPGGVFQFQVCGHPDTPEAAEEEKTRARDTWLGARFTEPEVRRMTAEAGFNILRTYFRRSPSGGIEYQYLWVVAQKPAA